MSPPCHFHSIPLSQNSVISWHVECFKIKSPCFNKYYQKARHEILMQKFMKLTPSCLPRPSSPPPYPGSITLLLKPTSTSPTPPPHMHGRACPSTKSPILPHLTYTCQHTQYCCCILATLCLFPKLIFLLNWFQGNRWSSAGIFWWRVTSSSKIEIAQSLTWSLRARSGWW